MPSRLRNDYTTDDDSFLTKYIATYNPSKSNRSGNSLYKILVEDVSCLVLSVASIRVLIKRPEARQGVALV